MAENNLKEEITTCSYCQASFFNITRECLRCGTTVVTSLAPNLPTASSILPVVQAPTPPQLIKEPIIVAPVSQPPAILGKPTSINPTLRGSTTSPERSRSPFNLVTISLGALCLILIGAILGLVFFGSRGAPTTQIASPVANQVAKSTTATIATSPSPDPVVKGSPTITANQPAATTVSAESPSPAPTTVATATAAYTTEASEISPPITATNTITTALATTVASTTTAIATTKIAQTTSIVANTVPLTATSPAVGLGTITLTTSYTLTVEGSTKVKVKKLVMSQNGKVLVGLLDESGGNSQFQIWEYKPENEYKEKDRNSTSSSSVALSADGKYLLTATEKCKNLEVWDLQSQKAKKLQDIDVRQDSPDLDLAGDCFTGVISLDTKVYLAVSTNNHTVFWLLDNNNTNKFNIITTANQPVNDPIPTQFSKIYFKYFMATHTTITGQTAIEQTATEQTNKKIQGWQWKSNKTLSPAPNIESVITDTIMSMALSPSNKVLAIVTGSNNLLVKDITKISNIPEDLSKELPKNISSLSSVGFFGSDDANLLIAGLDNQKPVVWGAKITEPYNNKTGGN